MDPLAELFTDDNYIEFNLATRPTDRPIDSWWVRCLLSLFLTGISTQGERQPLTYLDSPESFDELYMDQ